MTSSASKIGPSTGPKWTLGLGWSAFASFILFGLDDFLKPSNDRIMLAITTSLMILAIPVVIYGWHHSRGWRWVAHVVLLIVLLFSCLPGGAILIDGLTGPTSH